MPGAARVIHVDRSARLSNIVDQLNRWSSNFVAEQLVKTLGAEARGAPGTFADGLKVIEEVMVDEIGWRPASFVLENGSGLNNVNRVTARQLTRLLTHMHDLPEVGPEFVSSLGVAGRQGTISGRFRHTAADRRLRAKTGTLTGVSALSGYVASATGELMAFSILVNGYEGSTRPIWEVQDMIGEALALSGIAVPRGTGAAWRGAGR